MYRVLGTVVNPKAKPSRGTTTGKGIEDRVGDNRAHIDYEDDGSAIEYSDKGMYASQAGFVIRDFVPMLWDSWGSVDAQVKARVHNALSVS